MIHTSCQNSSQHSCYYYGGDNDNWNGFLAIEIIEPPDMAPKTKFHITFATQYVNGEWLTHMTQGQ